MLFMHDSPPTCFFFASARKSARERQSLANRALHGAAAATFGCTKACATFRPSEHENRGPGRPAGAAPPLQLGGMVGAETTTITDKATADAAALGAAGVAVGPSTVDHPMTAVVDAVGGAGPRGV